MQDTIRWGMIGCGDVAETKSGPAFTLVEGAVLQMVAGQRLELVKSFAERHGVPEWTDNPRKLIESPDVDAIYVATPPNSHRSYTELAAAQGKPVLTEKPMACNVEDAVAMTEACKKAGVPLYVAYYRRSLPRYLLIKEWVDSGRIGRPRFVHMQHTFRPESHPVSPIKPGSKTEPLPWRYNPEVGGGGNFIDMGTHTLDMIDYLLGPISETHGFSQNKAGLYNAEDTVSANFITKEGVLGTGQWCYVAGTNVDRMEIVGSEGAIRFSFFDQNPHELETKDGTMKIEAKNPTYFHQPIIQSATDDLMKKGKCPSTWENGLRAMRVQEKIMTEFFKTYTPSAKTNVA